MFGGKKGLLEIRYNLRSQCFPGAKKVDLKKGKSFGKDVRRWINVIFLASKNALMLSHSECFCRRPYEIPASEANTVLIYSHVSVWQRVVRNTHSRGKLNEGLLFHTVLHVSPCRLITTLRPFSKVCASTATIRVKNFIVCTINHHLKAFVNIQSLWRLRTINRCDHTSVFLFIIALTNQTSNSWQDWMTATQSVSSLKG